MKMFESRITGEFWARWQTINNRSAIFHQWDQLEATGCIDNFRIQAETKPVQRRGWYFADSDAYKWLEAAYLILAQQPDPDLSARVDDFTCLIQKTQEPDGYLFTYNQIHFPGTRWINLQIEHELYCHGHLIEACIAGYRTFDQDGILKIGLKAADRIVDDFTGKGPQYTPGHEEIEIALLRLYELTGEATYLEMSRQFLDQRGRGACFAIEILKQNASNQRRVSIVEEKFVEQKKNLNGVDDDPLPADNRAKHPPLAKVRFYMSALSGKLLQQHKPLIKQTVPVGHAVRWAYLQTAGAMLERLSGEEVYRQALKQSWNRMVERRAYITGGIGSLPQIEGFGRDYELDPGYAYAETCAALGSMYWNREMAKLTRQAQYSDLYEWQLYNAALVGMGFDGRTYLYNNPLESLGEIERRHWYQVPCCPSNLSRTWAALQNDILHTADGLLYFQQYISSQHRLDFNDGELALEMDSALPWVGEVRIKVLEAPKKQIACKLRQPSWAAGIKLRLNGDIIQLLRNDLPDRLMPQKAVWLTVERSWHPGDQLLLDLDLPIRLLHAHPKVRSVRGQAALARGPLVYCLESVDNPQVDLFKVQLDPNSLRVEASDLFDGIQLIKGTSHRGEPMTFIPYHLWGNRGQSQMCVFVSFTM